MGRNVIAWFEMPIRRLSEVKAFYENVFGFNIVEKCVDGRTFGTIQIRTPNGIDSCGVLAEYPEPLPCSSIQYFQASTKLQFDDILSKVPKNGGVIITMPPRNHPILNSEFAICEDNKKNKFGVIIN
ncbi:MAG: VOC family protein [Candidatus Kapabacteria bacterium]|nr:VOC family protein [Ignavibacteriota bacterium]MCW5884556.1 VOC family protein [Candidatus Kapabacteria bacterium]